MSKYTTELRFICETKSGYPVEDISKYSPDQIIEASRKNIFNFSYPIYEESHRPELERKILKHYYTREIGAETVSLWQLQLNTTLNDVMPKYNKLYQAERNILNKELLNIDVTKYHLRTDDLLKESDYLRTDNLHTATDDTRTDNLHTASDNTRTDNLHKASDTTRTDNLANSNTRRDKYSDTPQGTITNVDNDSYLTDYRNITDSGTNTGTQRNAGTEDNTGTQRNAGTVDNTGTQRNAGTVDNTGTQRNAGTDANTGTQEIEETEKGYRGERIYASLLADYADKVLNIDLMIINELADCFFKLW